MAYLFQETDNELAPKNQDIFAQAPGGSTQAGAAEDSVQKTSDQGVIPQGGALSPQQKVAVVSTEDRQKAMNLQAQRQSKPKITEKLGDDLTKAQTGLQEEANKYTQGYQNRDYREGVSKDVLQKAVQGDEKAYGQSFGRAFKQGFGNVDEFKPTTETDFQDIRDLESTGGIKNVFKREQGPQYRDQEAAFDTMLLMRNPEFRKTQQELSQRHGALAQQKEKELATRQKEAQKLADEKFSSASQGIKEDLSYFQRGIEDPLRKMEAEEDAKRAQLDRAKLLKDFEAQQIAAIQSEWGSGQDTFTQRAAKQLGGIDPNQYFSLDSDTDWKEFASDSDAAQFNRVMALLGGKDTLQKGSGPGEAVKYNTQGLKSALIDEAFNERRGLEARLNQERMGLLSGKEKQAEEIRRLIKDYGGWEKVGAQNVAGQVIPERYIKNAYNKPINVGAADLLSADEALRLNAYRPEIDDKTEYGAQKQDLASWVAALRQIQEEDRKTREMNERLGKEAGQLSNQEINLPSFMKL